MTTEDILKLFQSFLDNPIETVVVVIVLILLFVFTNYLKAYFSQKGKQHAQSSVSEIPSASDLSPYWGSLTTELQAIIMLAASNAEHNSKDRISTRDFFSAIASVKPAGFEQFLKKLPKGAMPDPVPQEVNANSKSVEHVLKYSTCVNESVRALSERRKGEMITAQDMFVDIAKNGKGESVRRLRTHGVDAEAIEGIVTQMGWKLIQRGKTT
jgi:hypothetical protein